MLEPFITVNEVENLVESFDFLSREVKNNIISSINHESSAFGNGKSQILSKMYNVYQIAAQFQSEELFVNGRITFCDDCEIIFDRIIGYNTSVSEVLLFTGCMIAKGNNSSYISLHHRNQENNNQRSIFNFSRIVEDAITPPQISIVVNIGFYPHLIDNIMKKLK